MTLLTGNPIKFGALVSIDLMPGHYLVVGWMDDKHRMAVVQNKQGAVIYADTTLCRVAREPRSWKDRKREHPNGR